MKNLLALGKLLLPSKTSLNFLKLIRVTDHKAYITDLEHELILPAKAPDGFYDFETLKNSGSFDLAKELTEDFPGSLSDSLTEKKESLPPEIFNDVDFAEYAKHAATDECRAVLCGIGITDQGVCATDGHTALFAFPTKSKVEIVLSTKAASIITALKKAGGCFASAKVSELNQREFLTLSGFLDSLSFCFTTKLLEGPYPLWPKVVPPMRTEKRDGLEIVRHTTELSSEQVAVLRSAVEYLLPFTCAKTHLLAFVGERLIATGAKLVQGILPFTVFDAHPVFALNAATFLMHLKSIKGGITVSYGKMGIEAVLFDDGTTTGRLQMPLRVWENKETKEEAEIRWIDHAEKAAILEIPATKPVVKTVKKAVQNFTKEELLHILSWGKADPLFSGLFSDKIEEERHNALLSKIDGYLR